MNGGLARRRLDQVRQHPLDGAVEQRARGRLTRPERTRPAKQGQDAGHAVRHSQIDGAGWAQLSARAEQLRGRRPPVHTVGIPAGPACQLGQDAREALRRGGSRPPGEGVGAEPGQPVDQVVRAVLRITPYRPGQRLVDVVIPVCAGPVSGVAVQEPVHDVRRPRDPGESRVQREAQRLAREHVDRAVEAVVGPLPFRPVLARVGGDRVADGQPRGAGRQRGAALVRCTGLGQGLDEHGSALDRFIP